MSVAPSVRRRVDQAYPRSRSYQPRHSEATDSAVGRLACGSSARRIGVGGPAATRKPGESRHRKLGLIGPILSNRVPFTPKPSEVPRLYDFKLPVCSLVNFAHCANSGVGGGE